MISYREAQEIVIQQARSFGREKLSLDLAYGRVLAESVLADRDYPPFNRATMDGYAVRSADLAAGIRHFIVIETLYAGVAATRSIRSGECYKIMTGAPVPDGADMVIRREDTKEDEGFMDIHPAASIAGSVFQYIAKKGEDLQSGEIVIDAACRCEPAIMGLLASLGKSEITVECLPAVALFTTGNEVVDVGTPVSPVQIRNSNRWLLETALKKWDIPLAYYTHCPDDKMILRDRLASALSNDPDIVLLCGGVSAGDADYVPEVLTELGVKNLFHKIAIKPGKPTWCGVTPGGGIVFALPGNPFSCLVNFALLIGPYLHACFGLAPPQPVGLPLGVAKKKKTPLDEFFPVRLEGVPGRLLQVALNGSGDIRLGLEANGLALHPAASGDLDEGSEVLFFSLV